ncbi:glutamate 5-kinase [Shewanella corallii]|uniref:Glutamate 5-kinase n=2 Tax=Shewanella TaxID=22 RepID=A0ABT0N3P9_9GAMM|nr:MULTISPECIES: glutamate 5-kinase [Shewanella]MCL1036118.1 glutamate 5-kinase [Shewanella submarina]MCL2912730.1 glutamate 5-kinase [Shewanella corallii]
MMKSVNQWKRVVVKVGSALISPNRHGCSSRYLLSIAQFILQCRQQQIDVVLVSSGSVAAGAYLVDKPGSDSVAVRKARAAAGQMEMMATWSRFFDDATAQLLITHADLRDKERHQSIRETLFALLDNQLLPIVNENDAVTTKRLKVGDNDNLAAMVAAAADADALILCTDIEGLYTANPKEVADATLVPVVNKITPEVFAMAGGSGSDVGTGGMFTKVEAAEKATAHGIDTYVLDGRNNASFDALLKGENPGTCFVGRSNPMTSGDHWMAHTVRTFGKVVFEEEWDTKALSEGNTEGLTSEVIAQVDGSFQKGDPISLYDSDGNEIARAHSRYSSCLLEYFATHNMPANEKVNDIIEPEVVVMENK